MITIHIDDSRLEQRIKEESTATGKSLQVVVEELLSAALLTLSYPRLNPTEHGYLVDDQIEGTNESSTDNPLFGHVSDAADYVTNLRNTSWRRQ
jgi:hypothetical protein